MKVYTEEELSSSTLTMKTRKESSMKFSKKYKGKSPMKVKMMEG